MLLTSINSTIDATAAGELTAGQERLHARRDLLLRPVARQDLLHQGLRLCCDCKRTSKDCAHSLTFTCFLKNIKRTHNWDWEAGEKLTLGNLNLRSVLVLLDGAVKCVQYFLCILHRFLGGSETDGSSRVAEGFCSNSLKQGGGRGKLKRLLRVEV